MNPGTTIIIQALPAVVILIICEVYSLVKEHHFTESKKDIGASLSIGLSALLLNTACQGINIFIYTFLYKHRLFTMPPSFGGTWIMCLVAEDLSFYWFHRLSHQVRFLWLAHVVHHSSERFSPSVAVRNPLTGEVPGTLLRAWMPLIGFEPSLILTMRAVVVVYQFFMHTKSVTRLPRWYEAIFNTPYYHAIHHSSNIEYLDKNHGGLFIIWDRLFGTFHKLTAKPKYGLTKSIGTYNPIKIAFYEWKNLFNDLRRAKSVKEYLNYIFNSPGWSHDGSSKTTKQLQSELNDSRQEKLQMNIKKIVTEKNYHLYSQPVSLLKYTSLLLITIILSTGSIAQQRKLSYDVTRNGSIIGNINFIELSKDQKKFLSLTSEVQTRFIFSFSDHSAETAAFENGIMVYSSFYQKQNGSEKANKKTIASGVCYKLMDNGNLRSITCDPIRYNMLLLFNSTPENINKVYSDNFQILLDIKKVEANKYRLTLPDGNYNYYTYKDGICSKVDIERKFFKIQFILRNE